MTKKDYEIVAKIIKQEVDHWQGQEPKVTSAITSIYEGLSMFFKDRGKNFNEVKFRNHCGL